MSKVLWEIYHLLELLAAGQESMGDVEWEEILDARLEALRGAIGEWEGS